MKIKRSREKRAIMKCSSIVLTILFLFLAVGCTVSDTPAPNNNGNISNSTDLDNQDQRNDSGKPGNSLEPRVNPNLTVTFIDVGQADAILIQIPNGKNILIDAGNNADAKFLTSYLKKQGIEEINILIGTHPHEDHIGSMDTVIENFEIGQIFMPKVNANTKTFEDVLLAIQAKGLKIKEGKAGVKLDLGQVEGGPELSAEILAPRAGKYGDTNNYSIVLRLVYGANSFLFTGDAEDISEQEMLDANIDLQADVLKVGHHGSNSSTTDFFLAKVKPKYAVIPVGEDNTYGHPTPAVLKRLDKAGVKIYRTDRQGTITAIADGLEINFTTEK